MTNTLRAAAVLLILSAVTPAVAQSYDATPTMQDVDPGVDHTALSEKVPDEYRRGTVFYRTEYPPGTIIVNTADRFLYLILGNNGTGKTTVLKAIALSLLSPIIESAGYVPYHLVRRMSKGVRPLSSAEITSRVVLHGQDVASSRVRSAHVE